MKLNVQKKKSCLKKPKVSLYFLLLLTLLISQCCAIVELVRVPLLDGKSVAEADYLLQNVSLVANKSYCFSDSIPKHFVIPGTQDPVQGTLWYKEDQVKVKISEGEFTSVIGMTQSDAEQTISDLGLNSEAINGRNETVPQGFIFDQEPKKLGCRLPDKVKIFVNAPLSIYNITLDPASSRNGTIYVFTDTIRVKGYLSSRLRENEHLWIAIKPSLSANNWWPQMSSGEITPDGDGIFQGNAYVGGNNSDLIEIGILILDNETNRKFHDWVKLSNMLNTLNLT